MSELTKKIDTALKRIDMFAPKDDLYYVCYSGGKDSDCIRLLCDMWGKPYELHNNHTTVDAPETVYYIREVMSKYGEKKTIYDEKDGHRIHKYGEYGFIHFPLKSMWRLIIGKGLPPTRFARYCCLELKEKGGKGRIVMTGVRWSESRNRKDNHGLVTIASKNNKRLQKKLDSENINFNHTIRGGLILNIDNDASRRAVEMCYRTHKTLVNPIIDWEDKDVWDFLKSQKCESNPLYTQGWKRIGCIGCPMAGSKTRKQQFALYPKYERLYKKTFGKMVDKHKEKGLEYKRNFDGVEVFKWWLGDDPKQITFEDYFNEIGEEW